MIIIAETVIIVVITAIIGKRRSGSRVGSVVGVGYGGS